MSRSKFWKDQHAVNRYLRKINKQLNEDVFSGRFEVKQVNRKDFQDANYSCYCPSEYTIEEASDPCWRYSWYLIKFIDNEEPERNVEYWAKWSDRFGLCDLHRDFFGNVGVPDYRGWSGLSTVPGTMSNFIVKSDFWDLWNNFNYAKTHWYSGKELDNMMRICGPEWESAETLAEARPDRFKK